MYRSSTGALDHYDDPPRGGERWDREKFERMRGGRGGGGRGDEHDHFRFQEHDRFPGGRRDIDIHEDYDRRGPPTRVIERERRVEDDRFDRPARRRNTLFDESTPSEVANRALAPYRRQSVIDKDIDLGSEASSRSRRPARPQYIRRQSSLDTFDRRPLPRYGDIERAEYRPPANVPIPLPIRERRRSPERRRFRESDEDLAYGDFGGGSRGREREEYREVEVSRNKSRVRRSKSVAPSTRSSSTSSVSEVRPARATWGKRGKTKLPKRLAKKQAVIDLGYPFEEEDDFIVITRALEKEHIDEVIKTSESYKEEKTTYVYDEKAESVAAPPPPPQEYSAPPPPPSVYGALPPPAPPSVHHAPSMYAHSVRDPSPPRHEHERYVEIERSAAMHGPATSFLPPERQLVRREPREVRTERDIREEIRSLEEERQLLKYERGEDYEVYERRDPRREIVRVDRDRKGRRDRPNPKIVAAMMSTLT